MITDGNGNASFYYEDTTNPGTPTLTAADSANPAVFGQQNEVVSAGLVTAVTFKSSPQTTNVGQLAGPITISVGFANEVVNLSSSSATGVFYNSTGPGAAVITSVVTDASGNASFYYEDPTTARPP